MTRQETKARGVRGASRGRAVPDPEPLGRGVGAGARGARVPGARDDELRLRIHARPPRRRRHARRGGRPRPLARPGRPSAALRRPRERLRAAPEDAAAAIARVAEAGAVGGSIEDYDPDGRLYELGHAAERIAAAGEAARSLDFPFVLTARAENHIRGNPDLDDTIARLQAYERAGADVLYAPGLRTVEEIRAVARPSAKPVNVLAIPGLSVAEIVGAGAQRISVGGGLTWVAVAAMAEAARRSATRATSRCWPRRSRSATGSPESGRDALA